MFVCNFFFVVYPEIVLQNAVSMVIAIKTRIALVIKDGLVPLVTYRPVLRSAFMDTVTILLGCVSVTLEFMVRCCVRPTSNFSCTQLTCKFLFGLTQMIYSSTIDSNVGCY